MDFQTSADPVIFIVKHLNEVFGTNVTLVDFDEKSSVDLLQTLNDVLTEVEPTMKADVRDDKGQVVDRMMHLLMMLKFSKDVDRGGLEEGSKNVIYPILHWLLEKLENHKKRAYVAKFLYPVDVPPEYLSQDETLGEKYGHYKHLQQEFKKAHQQVEVLRKQAGAKPSDIRGEIASFEEEQKQLQTRIEKLQKQNADTHDFEALLKATNALRLQQDEDAKLHDNMRRQKVALAAAESRKKEAWKRLQTLRSNSNAMNSSTLLLRQLQEEVDALERRVTRELPSEIDAKKEKVARLSEAAAEPHRTQDDVESLRSKIQDLEGRIQSYKKRLDDTVAVRIKEEPKLATFRQHASLVSKKLDDKLRDMDKLDLEKEKLTKDIDRKETAVADLHREGATYFLTREEFKKFGAQLREKTHVYKDLKAELSTLRAESVTLHRTEQILRSKVENVDAVLESLEKKRGVLGYRETKDKLERTAEATAEIDVQKEKTLEDISDTVKKITNELKEKKKDLAPQIHKLKDVRATFQNLEADFLAKKATYDKVAVGLDVERQQLERECDDFQDEALREESRFHYLNCLIAVSEATLKRIEDEDTWKAGKGRGLLPNFRTYDDLYQNKLAQQQAYSDQLRRQRAQIESTESSSIYQRSLYADLHNLLQAKLDHVQQKARTDITNFSTHNIGSANVFQLSA